jgi:predicted phosphodiesterase
MVSCKKEVQLPFTFVQLCDTQLGMGGYEHDKRTFDQASVQINELNPDFVVICGDLVHHATDSSFADFNAIKAKIKTPVYCAPGNHDVKNKPTKASLEYYRQQIGEDYFGFDHKGFSFLITNSQLWKENVGEESVNHNTWFTSTLKEKGMDNEVVAIGHYPLFVNEPNEKDAYFNLPIEKRQELLELFKENNVKAYLSGHTHKLVVNQIDGIQLVSGETTSKNFDKRPMGFRLWNVSKDTLIHRYIPLKMDEN